MNINNLHKIVVHIKDEAMLQEARGMLIANGQNIWQFLFTLSDEKGLNYLQYDEERGWWLAIKDVDQTVITLPELEQLLKQKRDER